jgi:hypothetical protein
LFFNENISQQHMNITELPDDVLHEVFARLPCRDVLTLGAVNQHLASLSRADTLWSLLVRVAEAVENQVEKSNDAQIERDFGFHDKPAGSVLSPLEEYRELGSVRFDEKACGRLVLSDHGRVVTGSDRSFDKGFLHCSLLRPARFCLEVVVMQWFFVGICPVQELPTSHSLCNVATAYILGFDGHLYEAAVAARRPGVIPQSMKPEKGSRIVVEFDPELRRLSFQHKLAICRTSIPNEIDLATYRFVVEARSGAQLRVGPAPR